VRRREFITVLGGAAAWPLDARAQQPGKLGSSTASAMSQWVAAFLQRLQDLGWVEGRTVAIEYRWAEGRSSRAAEIAAEFVRLKVNVIVTYASVAVLAAKQVTSVLPIVFAAAVDAVGAGLVDSLARPGGNVTGLSMQQTDAAGKRLQVLREVVPNLRHLAILANVSAPGSVLEMREVETAARTLGLEAITLEIRRAEDIVPSFDTLEGRAEGLYVCTDPLVLTNRARIHTLALGARLPTIYNSREYVEAGGLMSYGPNWVDRWKRTAEIVDKVLRGTKPADIPVEQPTKFDLVINLTTAKVLAVAVPPSLLAVTDEIIE
jgi:putative tryptophan/tyrosine transport system substrate-binding protein